MLRLSLILTTTVLIVGGLVVVLILRLTNTNANRPPGNFREGAEEAGIDFQMKFLRAEQGEKFKINLYDHGCGVAVADFDGDGFDDIYFLNQLGPNKLFRNRGDGTFEDVTERAGVGLGDRVCVAAVWGDYDNDGLPDLYVTSTRGGNELFKNLGGGKFKNVTKEAGLTCIAHSQTAVFFDFDNDGHLDLLVTNTAKWTANDYNKVQHYFPGPASFWELAKSKPEENILYRNNGDGTFTDVTAKSCLGGTGWSGDVAVFDYNDDGYLDLLVTNMFGASQLFRNNGDGTFTNVTHEVLGRVSWGAIGAKAFDFNNDGRLDLFITDMHSDMWLDFDQDPRQSTADLKKKYSKVTGPYGVSRPKMEQKFADLFKIRYKEVVFGNTLFKKLPSGSFQEVSERANLETWWPWGIVVGDFDNDGYLDIFIPSGMGYPFAYWPNALMMNNGNETFTDRAVQEGIEPPPRGELLEITFAGKRAARSSRCAAVADFTNTGRLDVIVNNFNDRPYYFRNHFPKKNYIAFKLTGTKSNRDAIGALVKLFIGDEVMVRQVETAGGYLSQSSRTVHFGLGDRTKIDRVEIRWPSGRQEVVTNPAINTLHQRTEPKE
jgi:hypothetical protein